MYFNNFFDAEENILKSDKLIKKPLRMKKIKHYILSLKDKYKNVLHSFILHVFPGIL